MRSGNAELLSGIALILLGSLGVYFGMHIRLDSDGHWGPRAFPLLASSILLLSGAHGSWSALISKQELNFKTENAGLVLSVLALSVSYVYLITYFGYILSTAIVSPAIAWLFGMRSPPGLAVMALACPTIYHIVFFIALNVFPPYGKWFDILEIVRGY